MPDHQENLMPIEKASLIPLLLFASRSFRFRCLSDAREDILKEGHLNEETLDSLIKQILEEEVKKAAILKKLEATEGEIEESELIQQLTDLDLTPDDLLSFAYQLRAEGFLESRFDEERKLFFKHVTSDVNALKPIYTPVNIIDEGNACSGCGACQAACPMNCIEVLADKISIDFDKCIRCGLCYTACPRSFLPKRIFEWKLAQRPFTKDETKLGTFIEAWSARTKVEAIDQVKQDGGIASSLLYHALQKKLVDACLGVKTSENKPWDPEPFMMTSKEDVILAAGTKYVNTATLKLLKELDPSQKIAVVGTPCMMQALAKNEIFTSGIRNINNISYKIGIFCMESFTHENISHLAKDLLGCDLKNVKKMDINMGKFFMLLENGESRSIEMKEIASLARAGCHCCHDLTSELADISVGSIGSPPGWNTVLIRNQRGKKLFDSAVSAGIIEKKPLDDVKPGINLLKKLSFRKKRKYESTENKRMDNHEYHPLYEMILWPKPKKSGKL
ncbi:MAG: Coenzyme F420 hydrogenase/dehydrogenase, beta subunit C-terminal domain [Promethearchaeota archaeon]